MNGVNNTYFYGCRSNQTSLSKKQLRITNLSTVSSFVPKFVNRVVTLILTDNTTVFGHLIGEAPEGLILQNMRGKKITFPIEKIAEIFADIEA